MKRRKGQAFFYAIIGLLMAIVYFGAAAPFIQGTINSIAPSQSVNTQIMLGLVLPGVALAIILGFFKAINPSGT